MDEQTIFKQWASFHREPTRYRPVDLAAERRELAQLSVNIQHLKNVESESDSNQNLAILQKFRQLMCWRLFPINSLPDDLILHIFRQGTFCSPDNKYAPTMPLRYSAICKRWRKLAMDASWLWAFLGFSDNPPYTLTKIFLARSRSAPLIIEINISDRKFDSEVNDYWPTTEYLSERLSMLLPHIYRWKAFSCCADNWAPLCGVLSILEPLAAPRLKRIEFNQSFGELPAEITPRIPIVLLGRGAPALQELVLQGVPINWHHLTFSNLTELALHRLSQNVMLMVQDFWNMLHQSPNLRTLILSGAGPLWDEDAARNLPTIELLCLEELELGEVTQDGSFSIEYSLFLLTIFIPGPALHTLRMSGFTNGNDLAQFVPVIRSHFSNVRCLELTDLHLDVTTAALWLHAMPQVNRLYLACSYTERPVLQALASRPLQFSLETAGDVLCPLLATLACDAEQRIICDFIHTRIEFGVPIRTLVLDVNVKDTPEVLDCFRGIVALEFQGDLYDSDEELVGPDLSDWEMEDGGD